MDTQGTHQTPAREVTASAEHAVAVGDGVLPTWTVEYFKANPLSVVWQSMLAIGGVILALHFVHIGFFPDMDWQSSLALVAIVALTGLLIWCLICLMLVFPSFTWSIVLEDLEKVPNSSPESGEGKPVEAHAEPDNATLEQSLSMPPAPAHSSPPAPASREPEQAQTDTKLRARKETQWPAMGRLAILFGIPTLMLWVALVVIIICDVKTVYESEWLMTLGAIAVVLASSSAAYRVKGAGDALGPRFNTMGYRRYFIAALVGGIVFVAPVALIYTLAYSRFSHTPGKAFVFTSATFLAFLFNLAAFRRWLVGSARKTSLEMLAQATLLGAFGMASLIAMTGSWVLIPEGVAYLYGIGNLEGATLVLDKEGCGVASKAGLNPELDADSDLCRLSRVKILNRLGMTYYVRSPQGANFTLPSSSVKSYEFPPPAVAVIHLEPVVKAGVYKSVAVLVTNRLSETLKDVVADVEFRDGAGRLTQSHRLPFDELPAGQELCREVIPAPDAGVDLSCRVVLTRYGRRLPYELK